MSLPEKIRPVNRKVTQRYGAILALWAADPSLFFEVQRAPNSGGTPGTWATIASEVPSTQLYFVDELPNNATPFWYRLRHVGPGYDPSDWTTEIMVNPVPLIDLTTYVAEARRRNDTLYAADSVLSSSVKQQSTGASVRRIAKGHLAGTAKNGDVLVFGENFVAPPLIVVDGGISYEPRTGQWSGTYNANLPQYFERQAIDVSVSGFTMRARLRQKGTPTNRTANFSASNSLTAVGHDTVAVTANAPANDDTYTINFSVSLVVTCTAVTGFHFGDLVVAVDTRIDGGAWVERATQHYGTSDAAGGGGTTFTDTHDTIPIVVSGLDTDDEIRLRIKSLSGTGAGGTVTCTVHGFDGSGDPASGVTYTTATGDIVASMTPDTPDVVSWHAVEVDA